MPAFPALTTEEVMQVLDSLASAERVSVRRIKYKNRTPITQPVQISVHELKQLVAAAIEDQHMFGGDLEVDLPSIGSVLVGQHDGVFWLEPTRGS